MTEATTAPAVAEPVSTTDARVARAIDLVWREAELLDRADYVGWNELFTGDGFYVVPIDPDTDDFENTLNMVYDDARMRELRVGRMTEGYAIAAVDAARTVRTVSRFVPESVSDTEVVLRSAQVLIAYKRRRHDIWAADLTHRVRLAADGPAGDRIALKIVRLVDSEDAVPAAGFLL
ncbi:MULTISPECIES: aromatic-ring-hydroxylating dioxygenase subunit beta [Prauserella salsuginis group]|uniref:3-phenylpropionate/cinnamic acid dioxygenase small subunit n=2 Tax=Prauserella salsuginis group TaxID=2893672 RepID=A0A839XLD5_9PSEU|nr:MULTISPECIES: aromatic-ring-hydroxylating dioxygenase subunit beta [Prauserella salsuginis group]MBB3664712.1 3-phenylpropionate/cinnamic acid dioxygenase small subunit [Prauserella sediminis]MCR3722178.1 3-phenylpropionate/cinnamic acid dioxygenase, small subunit [Prauserella flava]MCR3736176.1 3-phenylpropionate/cinnamic acid dioxygenase, small subunit [Prauserella salsuginis]